MQPIIVLTTGPRRNAPSRILASLSRAPLVALAVGGLVGCGGEPPPVTTTQPFLFTADDGVHGEEPWLSDGTPEGTRLLADVLPGPASGAELITTYFVVGDGIVFNARLPGVDAPTLFRSDGTAEGTSSIAETTALPQFAAFAVGDVVVFETDSGAPVVPGLYRTDGTAGGTVRLGDSSEDLFRGVRVPHPPAHLRHRATDGAIYVVSDTMLSRVDASGAQPIHTFSEPCNVLSHVGVLDTVLYFNASDPYVHPVTGLAQDARCELWRYDTAGGGSPEVHRAFTTMPLQRTQVRGFARRDGWLYYTLIVWDTTDDTNWDVVTRQLRATNGGPAPSDTLDDDLGDVLVSVDPGQGFAFLQRAPDEAIYMYGSNADTGGQRALVRLRGDPDEAWIEVVDANLAATSSVFEARFSWVGEHLVYLIPGEDGGLYSVRNGTSDVVELVSGNDALVWTWLFADPYDDRLFAWFDEPAGSAGVPGDPTDLVSSLFVTDGTPGGTARLVTFCHESYYSNCTNGD